MTTIAYTPPKTVKEFIKHYLPGEVFQNWIIGPVGSGKTTGLFFKLVYMASLQEPGPDGIRRTRAVVVRNTMPQLKDTTLASWAYWFKDGQAGKWVASENKFLLRFSDVECEVLFRALDTPDDIARVLSLEVTFAIIDEFVQIPKEIIDALSGRCGRWQPDKSVKVTNWGMWGSSNPGNEDDWWYDYLFGPRHATRMPRTQLQINDELISATETIDGVERGPIRNVFYFEQPSGFAPDAENLENLPGNRAYYTNLAEGKSKFWVRQYLENRWGFSNVGLPVLRSFDSDSHVSKIDLMKFILPNVPIIVGFDPGMNSAAVIMQQNLESRLLVFREVITQGMGALRFCKEKLLPLMRALFPDNPWVIVPDPAANSRTPTNEQTVVQLLRGAPLSFNVDVVDVNNLLQPRIEAAEHFTTRLVEGKPALLVDPSCRVLIRALSGGWRFTSMRKGDAQSIEPEKNKWSHPADAFCYGARYYHKGVIREYKNRNNKFTPPRFDNPYLMR